MESGRTAISTAPLELNKFSVSMALLEALRLSEAMSSLERLQRPSASRSPWTIESRRAGLVLSLRLRMIDRISTKGDTAEMEECQCAEFRKARKKVFLLRKIRGRTRTAAVEVVRL